MELINYCNVGNFVKSLSSISEDLYIVGLPPIVEYNSNNLGPCIVSLVNTIWTLLHHRQNLVDSKRDLDIKYAALKKEFSYLKGRNSQLENENLHSQGCLSKEKKKNFILKDGMFDDNKKLRCLKQELVDIKKQLRNKEEQFAHDLKRQEIEIALLQSKLKNTSHQEKGDKWKRHGELLSTCETFEDYQMNRHEEICKKSIQLESNLHQLIKENLELRKLLDIANDDLSILVSQKTLGEEKKKS